MSRLLRDIIYLLRGATSLQPDSCHGEGSGARIGRAWGLGAGMLVALAMLAMLPTTTFAGRRYAVASSNWNSTSTWSATSGGAAGASIPTINDTVYIYNTTTARAVTIPSGYNAVCKYLSLFGSTGANTVLTFASSTSTLYVDGNMSIPFPPGGYSTRYVSIGPGTCTVAGDLLFGVGNGGSTASRVTVITLTTGTLTVEGDLVYYSGAATQHRIDMTGGAGTLNLAGNISLTYGLGTLQPGTSSTVNLNGSAQQTLTVASSIRYNNLNINNTAGVNLGGAITSTIVAGDLRVQTGILRNAGYAIAGSTGDTFEVAGGAQFMLGGATGMVTGFSTKIFGSTSTVDYYGANQTISDENYGHLKLTDASSGTASVKTMPATPVSIAGDLTIWAGGGATSLTANVNSALTIGGNVYVSPSTTFNAGAYTHTLAGNWSMSGGAFGNTGSTITLNGAGAQTISSTGSFNNLRVNKTSGTTTMLSNVTVGGTLTFTSGNITTGSYTLIVPNGGSVSGAGSATGWVDGTLQKYFAGTSNTFEVGSSLYYSPVSITLVNVMMAGSLIVGARTGTHPNIASSNLLKSINRYWDLNVPASGYAYASSVNLSFTWNAADNYAPMNGAYAKGAFYDAFSSTWLYPTISGTPTTTTMSITGITSPGDFTVGEDCNTAFSYTGTPYCTNAGTASVTLASGAAAGTFTAAPAGLSLNSATGAITLASSTPGTYTVTNTLPGKCTPQSTSVTIAAPVTATISYASPFCTSGGVASVTRTGTAGGTYSSTAGLTINSSTGAITPSTSSPGTYTVTYTMVSGPCTSTATTSVTVNAPLAASVSISPSSPSSVCVGTNQVFTATPVNGGPSPSYQWKVNGVNAGSNSATFSSSSLANGDAVSCVMTSALSCVSGSPATSNTAVVTVISLPVVTNAATKSICTGTSTNDTLLASIPSGFSWTIGNITGGVTGASAGSGPVIDQILINGGAGNGTVEYLVTASPTALAYAGSATTGNQSYPDRLGSVFTVNSPVQITSLGIYDDAQNGLSGVLQVGIIRNSDGATVVGPISMTGSSDPLDSYFRLRAITPVTLPAGVYTVVSVGHSATDRNGNTTIGGTGTSVNTGAGVITFNSSSYGGVGFGLPTTTIGGNNVFHAGTFRFTAGCPGPVDTITITVNTQPAATISYAGTPYCSSGGAATVTRTGTAGGTYSSTAGLSINSGTGTITPGTSTPGTYTVTYTMVNGACSATATTSVTIVAPSSATISYPGSPFCITASTQTVTLTGATGGTFSAPAGLTINASTGAITPTTSTPGTYTVTYTMVNGPCTSTATTSVAINSSPTATISYAGSPFCTSSGVGNVTRTGAASGSYSAPAGLTINSSTGAVTPSTSTPGTYTVTYTMGASGGCSLQTATTSVIITAPGTWTGSVSTDWNTAGNWYCGALPTLSTDVTIVSAAPRQPVISAGTAAARNLTIQPGASLTVTAALEISGAIANSGTFTASSGSVNLKGSSAQSIPAGAFAGNAIKDLTITNASGVTLNGTLNITGVLKAAQGSFSTGSHLTLVSSAAQTALIDGTGTGSVLGNVTMQRYLPSGFGYRYISSPFQAAKVAQLADDVDLTASFANVYRYDENLTYSGWVKYTDTNGVLDPMAGYAVNFGAAAPATTFDLSGVVNDGVQSLISLYNHDHPYTQGFNLVGNPYPSPVDWNVAIAWDKINIDNAIYYFNNGSTDRYQGTYSTYINGVSSDGIASNIIPSMQGFFIHVSNGSFPVTASLAVDNNARVNNLSPVFHKQTSGPDYPMVRLSAGYQDNPTFSDPLVVYFDDKATAAQDPEMDAIKLLNTDERVPNFYSMAAADKLSINAMPLPGESTRVIPLGIRTDRDGLVTFKSRDILNLPAGFHPYFADARTGTIQDLEQHPDYAQQLPKGLYEDRFYLMFSRQVPSGIPGLAESLKAYSSGGSLFVYLPEDNGEFRVINTLGQVVKTGTLSGMGYHQINMDGASGIYLVSLSTPKGLLSGKVLVGQ